MKGAWCLVALVGLGLPHQDAACSGGRSLSYSVIACPGRWQGHIRSAQELCSAEDGFHLCSHNDKTGGLAELTWALSEGLPGCFAYDAAQDGDRCLPCLDDIASDDLAAVGRDCPHRNFGVSGGRTCLASGRVDASCCTDSLRGSACHFRVGITTGVLCCKDRQRHSHSPRPSSPILPGPLQAQPQSPEDSESGGVEVGERVEVVCPVASAASSGLQWWKGTEKLEFLHGHSFPIPFARPRHSALYSCLTRHGDKGFFNLTVKPVGSYACADGTSEGFHEAHSVRACAGTWKGEVRRGGKALCGPGWRVCGRKDGAFLGQVREDYVKDFGGCFAFNAAQRKDKCGGCRSGGGALAGLGGDCGLNRPTRLGEEGCAGDRWVEALSGKASGLGAAIPPCHQPPGVDGVLCCRRWSRKDRQILRARLGPNRAQPLPPGFQGDVGAQACLPPCVNGGTCLRDGRCLCPRGFAGQTCQHGGCAERCHNGGSCVLGHCKCPAPFYGSSCQLSHRRWLNESRRLENPLPPPLLPNHLTNSINKL